jgi:excisionase family DNA binding protein
MTALGISRSTLYRMIGAGDFPQPIKLGRLSRWPLDELENYVSGLDRGVC